MSKVGNQSLRIDENSIQPRTKSISTRLDFRKPNKFSKMKDFREKKHYTVKENAMRGVYVQNLKEIICTSPE